MNRQLQTLLHNSLMHYRGRHLKKALNSAQIALEFGINEGADKHGLINANIMMARIYNTNGRYQNEPSFFQKSLYYLSEAERLNELSGNLISEMDIQLIGGAISLNLKDHQKAEKYFVAVLTQATRLGDNQRIIQAMACMSQLYMDKGEIDEAVDQAEETLEFLKDRIKVNHHQLWAKVYLQLSQAYIKKQDYSRSLEMSQELLRLSRQIGDIEKEVIALRNIAVVCGVKSNYKIGMQFFLEALDKCESIGYRELFVQLQVNIGTLYAHLYNYPEAIKRYENVLEQHSDVLDEKTKVIVYNNLGNIYITTDQPEQALGHFNQAHVIAEVNQYNCMQIHALAQLSRTRLQLNQLTEAKQDAEWADKLIGQVYNVNGAQINLLNQAEIAFREKNYLKSLDLTDHAIRTAKRLKDDACEIRAYKHLARTYKAQCNFEKALEYEEKYGEIQEAFAKVQRNRQFLNMEIHHAIREKQKAIEQLTRENEYQALLLQKSDQISHQNQELMRANEELRQFAYAASHDLKEPLRMIGSYTKLVQRIAKKHLSEEEQSFFDYITGGVNRMNELLESLLKYATIGNSDLEFQQIDLKDVIVVSLANLGIRIRESNAEITYDQLPVIKGEKSILSQLFQNLISNAMKFVDPDQQPVIRIGSYELEDEWVIYVRDNGIGIDPQDQEKIFRIFHRLNAREAFDGTGIGLAICHKIVKRLHGRIWVESETGKGSAFYVAFPK